MKERLKLLIPLPVGLVIAVAVMFYGGLASAEGVRDVLRIVCDGFFVAGALLFMYGCLRWTYNGGVMDGLGYSAKLAFNRMRAHYDDHRQSFAEYRAKRESKSRPAKPFVISGAILLIVAVIIFMVYGNMA